MTGLADAMAMRGRALAAEVEAGLAAGDLSAAIRSADALTRLAPTDAHFHLLGELLLRAAEPAAALAAFDEITKPSGEVEAGSVLALLACGRPEEAAARVDGALRRFAVGPDDRLAQAANAVIASGFGGGSGWVGLDVSARVWGCAVSLEPVRARVGRAKATLRAAGPAVGPGGLLPFVIDGPRARSPDAVLQIEGRAPFLGSGLALTPDLQIDGRVTRSASGDIEGWTRIGWAPGAPARIRLSGGEGEASDELSTEVNDLGRRSFRFAARTLPKGAARLEAIVEVGAVGAASLPDSPLWLRPPRAPEGRQAAPPKNAAPRAVTVVVPVYRGLEETLACLASVRRTVGAAATLLVVDDATPEPELHAALEALERKGEIVRLEQPANRGFPASANLACAARPDDDIVLLNADAEVFDGWLEALREAVYAAADIGTATPLTNNGTIAAYPSPNAACSSQEGEALARLCASSLSGTSVEAPTGMGFCLYIRRDCLDATGPFDAELFAAGYGEETDFCLRAGALGWRHVICPGVFVRHVGGVSFGARAKALADRNMPLLEARHRGWAARIAAYIAADPLRGARRRLDTQRLAALRGPMRLFISHALDGGVRRVVDDRARAVSQAGGVALILAPEAPGRVQLTVVGDESLKDLSFDVREDLEDLLALIRDLPIDRIELHHFLDHDGDLIDAVLASGPPYVAVVHDYVWICPRITLIGGDNRYCGEPALPACETCLVIEGGRLGDGLSVAALRARSELWLSGASRIVAPSTDAARRIERRFAGLRVDVEPWEPERAPRPRSQAPRRRRARVAVLGAIGDHKGFQALSACAKAAAARDLDLEFVVIGFTQDDAALLETGKVFITGPYREGELDALIAREAPDVALFLSVWPETWCFTLTHALEADLPIVAFDIGAIAERLTDRGGEHVLAPLSASADELNDLILQTIGRRARRRIPQGPAKPYEALPDRGGEYAQMTHRIVGPVEVKGSVLPLEAGIYRFCVNRAEPTLLGETGGLIAPAVQVASAPGQDPGLIEIMTSLRGGAWLYEPGDMLLVKVNAPGGALILTSVGGADQNPIDVAVERMDAASASAEALAPRQSAPAPAPAPQASPPSPAGRRGPRLDPDGRLMVPLEVLTHVRRKGDMVFAEGQTAGAPGEGLAIEAFGVTPQDLLAAHELEYKGVLATGVETVWTGGGLLCGSRGRALALAGFAVRLRLGAEQAFECAATGTFASGAVVGPITDGALCTSPKANDTLVGIQIAIVRRHEPLAATPTPARTAAPAPRFSIFRESHGLEST